VDQAPFVTMSKEERVEAVKSSVSQSFLETQGLKFPNPQQGAGTTIPYNSNQESANQSSSIEKGSNINKQSTDIGPQLGSINQNNPNQDNRDITPVKNQDNTKQGSPITVDSDGFVNLARPKQSVGPKTFAEEKKDEEEKSWIEEELDKPKPQVIKKTVNKGSTSTDEDMKKDLEAMKKLNENN
jgi:hypothetical protein